MLDSQNCLREPWSTYQKRTLTNTVRHIPQDRRASLREELTARAALSAANPELLKQALRLLA